MATELPPWCRRIYASVDVVGSTALKQRNLQDKAPWVQTFRQFFEDFPSILDACFEETDQVPDGKSAHPRPMTVWKFVGDEILFTAELRQHQEAAVHALAFKSAINEYTRELQSKASLANLSLKGTIWGAGFPVSNAEVTTYTAAGEVSDYIGPCIDQGFRLCTLSDSRKITLSVDIAYFLARTIFETDSTPKMYCEEPKLHKGVPFPYPHIWMDREQSTAAEDEILGRKLKKPVDLQAYLEELYLKKYGNLFKPFIEGSWSEIFNQIPPDFIKARELYLGSESEAEQEYTESDPQETAGPEQGDLADDPPNSN